MSQDRQDSEKRCSQHHTAGLRIGGRDNDLAILRDFRIHERNVLTFRAEAFNGFNHANSANPSGSSTSTNEGLVTGTTGGARQMEFAVKYRF
jgi:hypothetical protein